jgi:hypothetical protein
MTVALRRFLAGMSICFYSSQTCAELHSTIVTVDPETGKAVGIRRYTRTA